MPTLEAAHSDFQKTASIISSVAADMQKRGFAVAPGVAGARMAIAVADFFRAGGVLVVTGLEEYRRAAEAELERTKIPGGEGSTLPDGRACVGFDLRSRGGLRDCSSGVLHGSSTALSLLLPAFPPSASTEPRNPPA